MLDAPAVPAPAIASAAPPVPVIRACLVELCGSRFAVDVKSAREVAVFDTITPVPGASRELLGVANLGGVVMPIVDVRPLLGLRTPTPRHPLTTLVVAEATVRVAIMIDAALGLEPFPSIAPSLPQPGQLHSGLVRGSLTRDSETIPLLDIASLVRALTRSLRRVAGVTRQPSHGDQI